MFESVMWKYIREEPEVLENFLATNEIRTNISRFASSEALYLVAHGSSYNAAVAIAPLISDCAAIRVYAGTPSYFRHNMHAKDLEEKARVCVMGISETGTSRGVIEALEEAKRNGFLTASITNEHDSPIDRLSDVTFFLNCGEEHSNAKTKGYSCTLLTLILFGIELAAYRKTIDESRRTELIGSLKEEIQKLNSVIDAAVAWCEENSYGKGMESLYVIGSGMHFGTAMEGQLKLMETQCIPTMFNDIVEFSHGMHRAITTSSNVILIRSPEEEELTDKTFEYLWKRKIPTVMINASKCLEMPGVINVTPFPFTRSILLVTAVIQVISAFVPERNGTDPNRASNNDYTDWAKTRI